jgi:NDP-sugar pyrophosphorylase family protein
MPKHIVILAGDQASRLRPRRMGVPELLMPVGDRPVLDLMLRHAAQHGFTDVTLAVGDLAPLIRAMFGDGGRFGVSISYSIESEPLSAASAVRLLAPDEPFLLVTGSVLTTLDLRGFHAAHVRSGNAVTVATHRRDLQADFAVLQLGDDASVETVPVQRYVERPQTSYTASMGLYAVQPDVRAHIGASEQIGLPALVERLIATGRRVGAFEHDGLSLDVGRRDDYEQAIARYEEIAPFFSDSVEREAA